MFFLQQVIHPPRCSLLLLGFLRYLPPPTAPATPCTLLTHDSLAARSIDTSVVRYLPTTVALCCANSHFRSRHLLGFSLPPTLHSCISGFLFHRSHSFLLYFRVLPTIEELASMDHFSIITFALKVDHFYFIKLTLYCHLSDHATRQTHLACRRSHHDPQASLALWRLMSHL